MNNSTVTIPLGEYKLMEKRIERKKDELISCYYNTYYGTAKQKEVLAISENARQDLERELYKIRGDLIKLRGEKAMGTPNTLVEDIADNYKKAISLYRLAIGVLATTIIIILFI